MTLSRRDLLSTAAAGSLATMLPPCDLLHADEPAAASARATEAAPGTAPGAASGAAPKRGGTLRLPHPESPAGMSILESGTTTVIVPMMAVFNNLVLYDQHVARNSIATIVPDLATEWEWSDGGKQLTFKLRAGVKWHDGTPFTAADVVHTWDLIQGRSSEPLRIDARRTWYTNVAAVVAEGDNAVVFRLTRPQPALLAMLASGDSPVYPRHVSARDMRAFPIGTGPFKFVEYKAGQGIKLARNEQYWKPDRPFLDAIEYSIVQSRATAILGFVSGKFDMTFPAQIPIPLLKDIRSQAPDAICQVAPTNSYANVCMNHTAPPFDNAQLRLAVALTIDRGEFNRILADGEALIGGAMLPPPDGVWGLPAEQLVSLPGYSPDVAGSREQARKLMRQLGYGPDKHLALTLSTRNLPSYSDPAVILIDQLKTIWIDATLETVDAAVWVPKMVKRNYTILLTQSAGAVDDPDQQFFESYVCDSIRNWPGFCDPALEKLFVAQSIEQDQGRRQALVWEIDKRLQQEVARPVITHGRSATCWHPRVKGLTLMVNSLFNGWRMEDVWLDVS